MDCRKGEYLSNIMIRHCTRATVVLILGAAVLQFQGCGGKPQSEPTAVQTPAEPVRTPPPPPPLSEGDQLAKQLRETDPQRRVAAANRLGEMAEAGQLADGPLQQLINTYEMEDSPDVVDAVTLALGKSCHPAALDILVRSLNRDVLRISGLTLSILGANGDFKTMGILDALRKRLEDDSRPEAQLRLKEVNSAIKQIQLRAGRRVECESSPEAGGTDQPPQNASPAEAGPGSVKTDVGR